MNRRLPTAIIVAIFLVGLSVLLYPAISDFINQKNQSKAIEGYTEVVDAMTEEEKAAYFAAAEEYNKKIFETPRIFFFPDSVEGYDDLLNASDNGIMGYISIDKIRVELPIYHGTSDGVLNIAAGHLKGTSLPIGGPDTHCVISAHRGLPSAKLFTDLDRLEIGDVFTITILDVVITYEVDQIRTVEPDDVSELQISGDKDYFTLLTCTPYGINTHRLLVRGHRIENIKQKTNIYVTSDAYQIDTLISAPAVAVPMLLILLIRLLIPQKRRSKKQIVNELMKGEDTDETGNA